MIARNSKAIPILSKLSMLYYLAVAICLAVLLQFGMWISTSINQISFNRNQFETSRNLVHQQIRDAAQKNSDPVEQPLTWNGYREFVVERLERPVASVTSVYLKPIDGKPIASFQAGQHLPLRFHLPGVPKPIVRCYSLSNRPGDEFYRISVKQVSAPPDAPDAPPGRVSTFINQQLRVGDKIEAKAPSGSFVTDQGDSPIILLAGGIGITPLYSMLLHLAAQNTDRLVVLFYGVRNGREHTFKDEIRAITSARENLHVVTCYSHPEPEDQPKLDYQIKGFVSVDLMKVLLPENRFQFYLCGPPPFMTSIRDGLLEWQIPETRIHSEAFGPASIKKKSTRANPDNLGNTSSAEVKFLESNKVCKWQSEFDSILDLAESNDVLIDSGCRAGSCGTCVTRILNGKVEYPDGMEPDCNDDECLVCVAKPVGNIELEA